MMRLRNSGEKFVDVREDARLGASPMATCLEIGWPGGTVQTLTDVKADRQIQLDEPAAAFRIWKPIAFTSMR